MLDDFERHISSHESWKYTLRVMEDETIIFKTQLADILSNDFERRHLEYLEVFQHRFLKMDEQIGLLRHELREWKEEMQHHNAAADYPPSVNTLQEVLAAKMEIIQDNFDALASDFKIYLHKYFPGV